jgi:hypothetical protein
MPPLARPANKSRRGAFAATMAEVNAPRNGVPRLWAKVGEASEGAIFGQELAPPAAGMLKLRLQAPHQNGAD